MTKFQISILVLVWVAWFFIGWTCSYADDCPRLLGDVNCDNQVDIHDYLALDAFLNGEAPEPLDIEAGDMDQDGDVDVVDCLLLAQEVGGLVR